MVERVVRKPGGEVAMHIKEVGDGVLVFRAVQTPQHHLAAGAFEHARSAGKL